MIILFLTLKFKICLQAVKANGSLRTPSIEAIRPALAHIDDTDNEDTEQQHCKLTHLNNQLYNPGFLKE